MQKTKHYMLVASTVIAIVPFGAVRPYGLSLAIFAICLAALMSASRTEVSAPTRWLFIHALILGGVAVLWVALQSSASLPDYLDNPIWKDLTNASVPASGSISIQPADSLAATLFLGLPLMTFLTGLLVIRNDEDARKLLSHLTIVGGAIAAYSLVQFLMFPESTLIFFDKVAYTDSLTATFVNRNSAGTFLGIVVLLLLRSVVTAASKFDLRLEVEKLMSRELDYSPDIRRLSQVALFFAISCVALLLTKSRGAIGSTTVAIFLYVILTAFAARRPLELGKSAAVLWKPTIRAIGAVLAVAIMIAIFGGKTLFRVQTQGLDDDRFCILPGIVELAKQHPLVGQGFGSFRDSYTPFRDPACGIDYVWQRAHNFYLEGFIGLGMVFVILLVFAVSSLVITHVVGFKTRGRMKSYTMLGLASLVLVGLQSLVDFSLEIPGVAAYLAAVLAATSAISLGRPSRSVRHRKPVSEIDI